jgi:hypothetical protein
MSLKDKIEKTMYAEGIDDRIQDIASLIDSPVEDIQKRMKSLSFSDYIKLMSAYKNNDAGSIKDIMGLEEQEQLEEAFFLAPWILPALATAVRVGAPALKLLLKGGKKAAPKVKDTTTNMIQKSTASGVIVGAVGKTVYDKVGDAIDGIKKIFGIDMDEDTLNIFAQIVVKYGIPIGAIAAVLYGGKQLKDYMTGEEENQTGNTTINNYYNGEPATEDIAKAHTKRHTLPRIDTDRYQARDGLEGPIMTKAGKVVYYDPKEGSYYDPDSDIYLSYEEWKELSEAYSTGSQGGEEEAEVEPDATEIQAQNNKLKTQRTQAMQRLGRDNLGGATAQMAANAIDKAEQGQVLTPIQRQALAHQAANLDNLAMNPDTRIQFRNLLNKLKKNAPEE